MDGLNLSKKRWRFVCIRMGLLCVMMLAVSMDLLKLYIATTKKKLTQCANGQVVKVGLEDL